MDLAFGLFDERAGQLTQHRCACKTADVWRDMGFGFLRKHCDQVAVYAKTCHDWVVGLMSRNP